MLPFVRELDRRDRLLARAGWFQVALLAARLVAMPFDHRTILGLNPWIKPSKFAVSIAIYVWTLAWFLPHVTGPRWAKGLIRWGTVVAMTVEIICIAGQSLRGTPSHFNDRTPLDAAVFGLMGALISFSTLLDVLLLLLFFTRNVPLPPTYLWGIRFGLLGVIVASGVGAAMVVRGAHSVGGADGGPGLPFVNWSTSLGDLRVSHAIGLHAFQVLPLVGYWLSRTRRTLSSARQAAVLSAVTAAYGVVFAVTLWQALGGRPL
ncbi:MAG: hypothetical protein HYX69_05220 [Planctomycetia bacterium]|nr:hypothetical protein [Planctomycetia bacterium]